MTPVKIREQTDWTKFREMGTAEGEALGCGVELRAVVVGDLGDGMDLGAVEVGELGNIGKLGEVEVEELGTGKDLVAAEIGAPKGERMTRGGDNNTMSDQDGTSLPQGGGYWRNFHRHPLIR